MPRDATETRERLLAEAERLFASRGVHRATSREITEAAEQRNTSALTYHFGSRAGALREILRRHGAPLDEERARLVDEPLDRQPTRDLVAALVVPYTACVETPRGRNYLRIVAQLVDTFAAWRIEADLNPPHLRRILATLEQRVRGEPAVQRERIVHLIMLMTEAAGERARQIDDGDEVGLDDDRFATNLTDTLVAILEAPIGPAVRVAQAVPGGAAGTLRG
jgi:AcrR family transcriptional regulator